ncbi:MAG: SDR family oxidoreductase [Pseudomonadales bacterium]|jgi:NAD(P)-dependent dehydrogenase (short-subunit alcohol dehydrogenase family)|nr:SDR family oxidoreductase [Pseudomonadales bacterium]MCP5320965.1 SDR family oxidoreductase [Pseudomonadales bacterium]
MNRLAGKVAIVTGAGRIGNIGVAVCDAFLREGATAVVATDLRHDDAEAITARMEQTHGKGRFLLLAHDVTDEAAWRLVLARTLDAFGTLDVLVNNAGMSIHGGIESTSIADLRKVMAVNHDGLFLGIKTCVPALAEAHTRHAGGGAIVNNLSMASYMSNAGNIGYHVSKAAGRMLTLCAANEFGPRRIRVNSIHPGVTMTPLIREGLRDYVQAGLWPSEDEAENALAAMSWLKTTSQPEDTAHAFVYLASEEARFVTGAMIMHDGGIGSVY